MNHRFAFFKEFLKHPLQLGSITPSSHFLERRITAAAGVGAADTIVELGPGSGGTTRAILGEMAPSARLLSIEINPHLHRLVSRIQDSRLIVHLGNVQDLKDIISMYGLNSPEALISGIPFSTINHGSGFRILEAVAAVLAPGGRFVAYQVSRRVADVGRPFLGPATVELSVFNIPPMRIFRWEKNSLKTGPPDNMPG
jgi:phospholipid N-methyltransferase